MWERVFYVCSRIFNAMKNNYFEMKLISIFLLRMGLLILFQSSSRFSSVSMNRKRVLLFSSLSWCFLIMQMWIDSILVIEMMLFHCHDVVIILAIGCRWCPWPMLSTALVVCKWISFVLSCRNESFLSGSSMQKVGNRSCYLSLGWKSETTNPVSSQGIFHYVWVLLVVRG